MFKQIKYIVLGALLIISTTSMADTAPLMQTSRYTTVLEAATAAQINPLNAIVQVHFNKKINTVGDAVNNLLLYSGYRLAPVEQQSIFLQEALRQPLPWVDRELGPLVLRNALVVLVGRDIFTLKQDQISRTINFELTPYTQRLIKEEKEHSVQAVSVKNNSGSKK